MEETKTKYIYSAYGKEFTEIMTLLREQGINTKIDELAQSAFELIKDNNVDRTQLEMYICNNFRFKLLKNVMDNTPITMGKPVNAEDFDFKFVRVRNKPNHSMVTEELNNKEGENNGE